jgi:alpha-1,6-mannosyltransferase
LASADAFVHAGDAETFGLGALEAMACGTPVVGCLGGAMTELVDRRVGRVADMPEARRMAEAMDALADEGLRRRLGDAARLRSLHYDWDAVLERISERYAGLAQRTGRLNALVSLAGQAGHARPSAAGSRQADGRATAASRPHVAA